MKIYVTRAKLWPTWIHTLEGKCCSWTFLLAKLSSEVNMKDLNRLSWSIWSFSKVFLQSTSKSISSVIALLEKWILVASRFPCSFIFLTGTFHGTQLINPNNKSHLSRAINCEIAKAWDKQSVFSGSQLKSCYAAWSVTQNRYNYYT